MPEHDVDDADGDEQQQAEILHRLLEDLRRALERRSVIVGGSSRRARARRIASTAAPSETPGRSPNEIVTAGSWPEWLTVCGPTSSSKLHDRFERHQRAARRLERRSCRASRRAPDTSDRAPAARGTGVRRRRSSTTTAGRSRRRARSRCRVAFSPTAAALSRSMHEIDARALRSRMSSDTSCTSGSAAIACSRLRRPVVQLVGVRGSGRVTL